MNTRQIRLTLRPTTDPHDNLSKRTASAHQTCQTKIEQNYQSKTNQADPLKLPTDPHDNLSKRNDNADQISQSTTKIKGRHPPQLSQN